jgi:alkylation response protein AidB-like acyl-CoA dehydrogenase
VTLDTEPTRGGVVDDPIELARTLAEEFRPQAVEQERSGEPPTQELARVRETGLVNLHIPTEFGGGGGNWQQLSGVVLELSRVDPNIGGLVAYHYHNFIPPFLDPLGDAAESSASLLPTAGYGDISVVHWTVLRPFRSPPAQCALSPH